MLSADWLCEQYVVWNVRVFLFFWLVFIDIVNVWLCLLSLHIYCSSTCSKAQFFIFGHCSRIWVFLSKPIQQLVKIEEIVSKMRRATLFDDVRVVNVLKMCAYCNLVSLVVLVYECLVSAHWTKIYLSLLIKLPTITNLFKFFWVEFLISWRCWIFVVFLKRISCTIFVWFTWLLFFIIPFEFVRMLLNFSWIDHLLIPFELMSKDVIFIYWHSIVSCRYARCYTFLSLFFFQGRF